MNGSVNGNGLNGNGLNGNGNGLNGNGAATGRAVAYAQPQGRPGTGPQPPVPSGLAGSHAWRASGRTKREARRRCRSRSGWMPRRQIPASPSAWARPSRTSARTWTTARPWITARPRTTPPPSTTLLPPIRRPPSTTAPPWITARRWTTDPCLTTRRLRRSRHRCRPVRTSTPRRSPFPRRPTRYPATASGTARRPGRAREATLPRTTPPVPSGSSTSARACSARYLRGTMATGSIRCPSRFPAAARHRSGGCLHPWPGARRANRIRASRHAWPAAGPGGGRTRSAARRSPAWRPADERPADKRPADQRSADGRSAGRARRPRGADGLSRRSWCLPQRSAPRDPGSGRAPTARMPPGPQQVPPIPQVPQAPPIPGGQQVPGAPQELGGPSGPIGLAGPGRLLRAASRLASHSRTRCSRPMRRARRSANRWRATPRRCGSKPSWRGNPGCPRTLRRGSFRGLRCQSTSCAR